MTTQAGKRDCETAQQTVKFFEALLRASADGIVITNETQSIILANEAFCSYFNRRVRDVLETSLFDWLEQLDGNAPEQWTILEKTVYLEGFCRDIEFKKKTKEGTRYLNVNASILEQVANEETGVIISIWRDITKRKQAETELKKHRDRLEETVAKRTRALKESEKRFKSLSDAAFEAIFISENSICVDANQAAVNMFGYKMSKLRSSPCKDLIAPEYHKRVGEKLSGRSEDIYEAVAIRKDGSTFPCEIRSRIVFREGQEMRITALRDITRQKQAQEKQLELETRTRQAQKFESLNVLAGSIAHNFNNLLMAVLGNLELAREGLSPGSPQDKNVERAEIAARRAARLSRLMLTYVGQNTGVFQTIDLKKLIEGMTGILNVSVSDKAMLKIDHAPNPLFFKGDPGQVHELIINFISNAVEALDDKKGTISLSTGTMFCDRSSFQQPFDENLPEGDYVYIEVADDGCGMDGETLAKIFDPYFTTKFTGRGMGLAAVLGIVRAHKGLIKLESKPGKGTVVRALFPACGPPEKSQREMEPPTEDPSWRGSGTILLVDDEDSFLDVGKTMLETMGFRVLTAPNGFEAIEIYRESREEIVCVILDIIMPCMGGKDVFHELRKIRDDVPVIFCSAFPEEQLDRKFADILPVNFIEKPFRRRDLAKKVRLALKK